MSATALCCIIAYYHKILFNLHFKKEIHHQMYSDNVSGMMGWHIGALRCNVNIGMDLICFLL